MKRFCGILAVVLFIVIISCQTTALALTGKEKEEHFNAALHQLETYLETFDSDSRSIDAIVRAFRELDNYSNSLQLWNYALILQMIEEGDFGVLMDTKFAILEKSAPFADYISSLRSAIRPVSDLEQYARGREAEKDGKPDEANQYYLNANGFFDSHLRIEKITMSLCSSQYDRAIKLYGRQKYEEAYALFVKTSGYLDSDDMAASIVSMLGYTPGDPSDAAASAASAPKTDPPAQSAKAATPTPAPKSNGFAIYASEGANIRTAPSAGSRSLGTTKLNQQLTAYETVPSTDGGKDWYRVEYNGQDAYISVSLASQTRRTVAAAVVTATPSKAPIITATPSKAPVITTTPVPVPEWGAWSAWSTTAVTASSTRQVETQIVQEYVYATQYSYSRWRYIGKNGNAWYAPSDYSHSSNYLRGGEWQYKTTSEPLAKNGTAGGKTVYTGSWYNETKSQVQTGTKDVTQYRYRDRR